MTSAPHPDEQVLARFDRIRARTECSFARAARLLGVRPYDLALTLSPREADRIVKPATYGAPPVPWWED